MHRTIAILLFLVSPVAPAEPLFRDRFEGGVPCVDVMADAGTATRTVNLDPVEVLPQFLLDGAPFPQDPGETAVFTLEDRDGFQVQLGASNAPQTARRVLPGVYDLYYTWQAGMQVPRNERARLLQSLWIHGDGTLRVDVPSVQVAGTLGLDGAPFPSSLAHRGRVSLQGVYGRGRSAYWATHTTGAFSMRMIPGAYHVVYEHLVGDGIVPRNAAARVARLALDGDTTGLQLDVPSVAASFSYVLDGAPLPAEDYEDGVVELVTADGDRVPAGRTSEAPQALRLVPGTYDLRYSIESGGTLVPRNTQGVLATEVSVTGPTEVSFAGITAQVTLLWDGAPPPASIYDHADLVLVDRATGGETLLGNSRNQPFSIRLLPGSYDLRQRTVISNGNAPLNSDVLVASGWQPQADAQLSVDVPLELAYLQPLLNGVAFPGSIYQQAQMLFEGADGVDQVPLGSTSEAPWSVPLVAGTYRVRYRHDVGDQVPANPDAALVDGFRVGVDSNLPILPSDLPVHASTLALTLRFDGVPLPAGNQALFHLLGEDEQLVLGTPGAAPLERFLVEGTYRLRYQYQSGAGIPRNAAATVACLRLQVP